MLQNVEKFLKIDQKVTMQFVEPDMHRINAAERAIQTFKNHFISGSCTVDKIFLLQSWDETLEQCELALNSLRTSGTSLKLSAHALSYPVLAGLEHPCPVTAPGKPATCGCCDEATCCVAV